MFSSTIGQKQVQKVERIAKGAMREFGFRGIDLFSRLMVRQKNVALSAVFHGTKVINFL